jgi:hypothetical protein
MVGVSYALFFGCQLLDWMMQAACVKPRGVDFPFHVKAIEGGSCYV